MVISFSVYPRKKMIEFVGNYAHVGSKKGLDRSMSALEWI